MNVLSGFDVTVGANEQMADAILDSLFINVDTAGDACPCSCHPRLADSDLHDYGFRCSCQLTADERRTASENFRAMMDAYWESSEGQARTAARCAEEADLAVWLAENPDVSVTSHGGWAPEQWEGAVEGRRFYFRERHDDWRIEFDLRPSGRSYRVRDGGDWDDDAGFEQRESEEGDVIAEGTTRAVSYGSAPAERAGFIIGIIRTHIERERCLVHRHELDDLEPLLGQRLKWCPACGQKV